MKIAVYRRSPHGEIDETDNQTRGHAGARVDDATTQPAVESNQHGHRRACVYALLRARRPAWLRCRRLAASRARTARRNEVCRGMIAGHCAEPRRATAEPGIATT